MTGRMIDLKSGLSPDKQIGSTMSKLTVAFLDRHRGGHHAGLNRRGGVDRAVGVGKPSLPPCTTARCAEDLLQSNCLQPLGYVVCRVHPWEQL